MSNPGVEHLPIRTIARLTGVNPVTLRAWERRYGLFRPSRTAKGHRLYTHGDVERIRRVLALVERGVPISRVRALIDVEDPGASAAPPAGPWPGYLERMAAATARFDDAELDRVYDEALSIHSIDSVTHRLLLPLLVRLGQRWQDLPGAIAEEHFFAAYMRSKLGSRLQHRMRQLSGPRILAACAPGEQHEIGLLLFALEAQRSGLRTLILGADTPLAELAAARLRAGCSAIAISSSIDPAPSLLAQELPVLVRQAGVPVFVGGATAVRHRQSIEAAGAMPVGTDLQDGVRLIALTLDSSVSRSTAK
jgi:DNA-binding transcriptional MerR regulator